MALAVGLGAVAAPARGSGYLTSRRLLDVVTRKDLGRFAPLVVIVVAWGIVAALLAHLLIEGRSRWNRRHTTKDVIEDATRPPARRRSRRIR